MFEVNSKDTRATPVASFWCLYCQLRTYLTLCSSVSIVNFEQVNDDWVTAAHIPGILNLEAEAV